MVNNDLGQYTGSDRMVRDNPHDIMVSHDFGEFSGVKTNNQ